MGTGIGVLGLELPFSDVDKMLDLAGDLETDSVPCFWHYLKSVIQFVKFDYLDYLKALV